MKALNLFRKAIIKKENKKESVLYVNVHSKTLLSFKNSTSQYIPYIQKCYNIRLTLMQHARE